MSITLTGGTSITKTIQFSNGVANVNIHELLGELDTGEPGVSIATLRSYGLTTFIAEIKDAANNHKTVTIHLNLQSIS